jgi:uncharacterized membrane protein
MGPEDVPRERGEGFDEAKLAAEVAALSARVAALEKQLADLYAGAEQAQEWETQRVVPTSSGVGPLSGVAPPPLVTAASRQTEEVAPGAAASTARPVRASGSSASLESKLGGQVFNRLGIVALLCGAALFLKLAMDNHLIGPVGRVVVGLIAGAGLVVWSERFRRKGFAGFSYSLKAIGTGVLYLSLWAAFQLYHLLPAEAALGGMILVTAWNAYMAWAQDSELLAAYAVAGGLATPLLLSSGGNHEVFLFSYLLAIDAATVLLVRLKPWARLLLGAFPATVVYFVGWCVQYFSAPELAVTAVFVVLFGIVFASVPVELRSSETEAKRRGLGYVTTQILLPFWNAAFVSLALYFVLQDSGNHALLPWLMVGLAAVYLLVMRLPQDEVAAAMHLSIAVVFLTIAIPLKASGHWITVAWLVEGLALTWVATRVTTTASSASHVLRWLAAGAFVLGLCGLIIEGYWFDATVQRAFFGSDFSAAVIAIAALGAAAWLAFRVRASAHSLWMRFAVACLLAIALVGLLLCLREVATSRSIYVTHAAFASADFAMALVGIATFGAVAWVGYRMSRADALRAGFWRQFAGGSVIAVNLMALLTGEREISALWPNASAAGEAQLQQALAVSAFLMVYGAVLLAIGFWKRTAFVRWQALLLIVFTIAKTFLYDVRNLNQGYRVMSLLGLGALLMAVSFAYQRDWLALRDTRAGGSGPGSQPGVEPTHDAGPGQ